MHYHSRKYIKLVTWIANADNSADNDAVEEIAGYLTVKMVADCYELRPIHVAQDVVAIKKDGAA